MSIGDKKIGVVVPCYKVREHVLGVIAAIPEDVDLIVCVDDGCPEHTADLIQAECSDPRVRVVRHSRNLGVGGATISGYRVALDGGMDVVAKVDGDGQMDPAQIPYLVGPIVEGRADYAKGNRFYYLESLAAMPRVRVFGNAALSFLSKLSTGYWNVFDPTNGYTAIHADVLRILPLDRIATRYFFESDLLFQLGIVRAVVVDVPMYAVYGGEKSSLSARRVLVPFFIRHCFNFVRRFFYGYLLRDFNVASVMALVGLPTMVFGASFGLLHWIQSIESGRAATAGTVMVSALPLILGFQLLLAALNYDVSRTPKVVLHHLLRNVRVHGLHSASPESRDQARTP